MRRGGITIIIPGQPIGKGRARGGKNGHYTPATTRGWEKGAKLTAKAAAVAQGWPKAYPGPVEVTIMAKFMLPVSSSKAEKARRLAGWHTQVPDADNVAKAVLDALRGIVFKDDCQVVGLFVSKMWGTEAGVKVRVEMVGEQT